jgi:xanthine dehydrogenase YagS FAD-binding subunit
MRPFSYERAADISAALEASAASPETALLAGGTTLLDLMKLRVMTPEHVVDITPLGAGDPALTAVQPTASGGAMIGALARMSVVADHPLIRERYPLVAAALLKGASAQLRNMATIGGNLLQRTRCVYFRDVSVTECNKREPGSGCAARLGLHRGMAVLGTSEACIATHPSDLAVALVALDALVHLTSASGQRAVLANEFFLLPGETPWLETALAPGELITAVELPSLPPGTRSHYLKVRDRESYEFALASAAVAVQLSGDTMAWARVALGGVATKPWRAFAAEEALIGRPVSDKTFAVAAAAAVASATPLSQNGFKITLAQRTVARALATVTAGGETEERA